MLARLFVIVGGLFVLALSLALVGPYLVDWSSYRAGFEREASAVFGRKVTVQGEVSARLLPFPSVTFSDVTVGAGSGEPAMTVETFSMDAELAPLLHGEFLIFDMRLVRPRALVEIATDGTVDWAVRPSAPLDAARITVESLSVTDGEVVLRHGPSGREHRLSDIDARLSARTLAGPWAGSGTLNFDGQRLRLSGSTGTAENGALRLKLDAVPDRAGIRITTEGNVTAERGTAAYAGTFRLAAGLPEAKPGEGESEAEADYRIAGRFALDARGVTVPEFRFETGPRADPYAATGEASLAFAGAPGFTVKAKGDQLRLDSGGEQAGAGLPLADRLAALLEAVRGLPKPPIPGTVELDLPALVAGDTTVRDVRLSAEPMPGGWRIRTLSALLPGRTTLEASGQLSAGATLGFEGSLLLAVAQPSGFAAWLGRDVDDAVRALPSAGFSANVELAPEHQRFSDLEIVLGDARLRGSAESRMPAATEPALAVRLAGGALDLSQADAFASLLVGDGGLSGFGSRNLDFSLQAGPLRAGGFTADKVDVALKLDGAGLSVRRLLLEGLAGATIEAAGTFSGPEEARTGALSATVTAADLEPLIAQAAERFPRIAALRWFRSRANAFPELFSQTRLKLDLRTEPAGAEGPRVALKAEGATGGSDLSLDVNSRTWLADIGKGETQLELSVRNADGAPLLALAGLDAAPLGLTGPATVKLSAQGVPAASMTVDAALTGEKLTARLKGTVAPTAAGDLAWNGPVALDAENIEPWLLTIGAGLPGFGLGTPADFTAQADYADGLLVLSGLSGSVDEESVAGDLNVAWKNGLPEITGALALDDFDLPLAASLLLGEGALEGHAEGGPDVPFRQTLPAPFTAGLSVSAGALDAGGLGALSDADFTLSLDAGRIALSGLSAKYGGGRLKGAAEVKNNGGTALLSAQFDLKGAETRARFANASLQAAGDVSASLTASGKSVNALIAGLGGSGTATLRDLTLHGLNGTALSQLLAAGDAAGPDIDAAAVEGFAPAVLGQGAFQAPRADFAFTVTGGVVRTPPFSVSNDRAGLSADLRADLAARSLGVRGRLAFDPGSDALVGSEPAVGFTLDGGFGSARLGFDTAPLAQFLVQRTLEREQARVEALQGALLEKQRLRRETRYGQAQEAARRRAAAERDRQTEAARIRLEDRAALEAAQVGRAAADTASRAATQAEEETRRKVEAAIRLAETERARQSVPRPEAASPDRGTPVPAPSPRALNLDALQPASGDRP